jgi:hypothetical protein
MWLSKFCICRIFPQSFADNQLKLFKFDYKMYATPGTTKPSTENIKRQKVKLSLYRPGQALKSPAG